MKQLACSLLMVFCLGILQAQVSITNDFTRNGTRIIELNYKGVAYSILYDKLSLGNPSPRMLIRNLQSNNQLEFKLPNAGDYALELTYGDDVFLSASGKAGRLLFNENQMFLDDADKEEIHDFAKILSEVKPSWPEDSSGTNTSFHDYRIVGVAAGGSRSIAVHRCEAITNGLADGTECTSTADCHCVSGNFLCLCVCGLICE